MTAPFRRRTRECQRRLRAAGADAAVLFPSANTHYLSGFVEEPSERPLYLVVPADGDPTLLAPALTAAQLRDATWVEDVRTYADDEDPDDLVATVVADHGLGGGHLLVDPTMHARFTQSLRAVAPAATWGLADEVLAEMRVRKDETERAALRDAAAVADEVMTAVRAMGRDAVGRSERELAREVTRRLADAGGEGLAFEVIVAAGPNGARPHHRHGDRTVRAGDPVVFDFGTTVDHYPSDTTRTVVFGADERSPPEGFADAHRAVRDAQAAAVEAVEPGATAGEVDAAARDLLTDRGYGDAFVHRTGHGVGLDVHEEPYVVAGSDRELEPGMAFSVEPGVYLDGEFGVRIEDLVLVTEDGCERLNDTSRGWRTGGA